MLKVLLKREPLHNTMKMTRFSTTAATSTCNCKWYLFHLGRRWLNAWKQDNELPKAPDGKELPISIEPKDKGRLPGFFESLSGYARIEYLRKLMGVKDRLYENGSLKVYAHGTAANPTYVPTQENFRIIGCTGIPKDSHELMWFRVYMDKLGRCPLCGHACVGYDYDEYMREADFVVEWANKLTPGIKLEGYEREYDAYNREDILNLAEEGPEEDWQGLRKILHDHYNSLLEKRGGEEVKSDEIQNEEETFLKEAANNRFINVSGTKIIEGKVRKV